MSVFATRYLEGMSSERVGLDVEWNWHPSDSEVEKIYASGANTSSRESTYAAETDNRADRDRPNEGMLVA